MTVIWSKRSIEYLIKDLKKCFNQRSKNCLNKGSKNWIKGLKTVLIMGLKIALIKDLKKVPYQGTSIKDLK